MDGIANVARQQQSQVNSQEAHAKTTEQMQSTQEVPQSRTKEDNSNNINQLESDSSDNKITTQKDVNELVKNLNDAMTPLSTDIKFGVDQNNVFYVAAIDVKTDTIIRRFPAEKAQDFLPKMQEVSGILFDSKG
jgi:flagellar protein FlaG